ncbi:DUF2637 domain-containing protein [Streptomyces scopuliridis]|uniref:DUF2637 domain-containing protein n=1 Tax=Streptomyces scopuliridis TaxID=452529 RepID=UPI0036CD0C80
MQLTRTHRILIGIVVFGAVIIAAIGFAGSYTAVRKLATQKGFGDFSYFFPIGIDAGICVLLALDLLLTWMRIPFPVLRQSAWLLTAATIAFNGAAAWPDPLGVGMHAVIPLLFVVSVEAARHAVGRIADITADKHMEGVRLTRWLLSPVPTFKLWRRMKLWELRSYEQVIKLEQDRLIYQSRLQARFGRNWRRKAPIEALMPLRLAKYGVPLADTAPSGLAAAGIEPVLLPPAPPVAELPQGEAPVVEHKRVPSAVDERDTGARHEEQTGTPREYSEEGTSAVAAGDERPEALVPDEYFDALRTYVARHGGFPNARQFSLFLQSAYGVIDPLTGGPLPEARLRPLLQELRQRPYNETPDASREPVTDEVSALRKLVGDESAVTDGVTDDRSAGQAGGDVADGRSAGAVSDVEPHPFFGPGPQSATGQPMEPQPYVREPVPASTASAADDYRPGGGVPPQTPREVPSARSAEVPVGEPGVWEAAVTDTGAATARLPEQQTDGSDLDPLQQQIVTVARWLAEAEDAGEKLSGAEVARRLGLSPKTGQRRVNAAAEYLEAERRQQGRAHLRSVSP